MGFLTIRDSNGGPIVGFDPFNNRPLWVRAFASLCIVSKSWVHPNGPEIKVRKKIF